MRHPIINRFPIIPYQELLGNYDNRNIGKRDNPIIPYQELLGNYDPPDGNLVDGGIIPYQELLGNYDAIRGAS